METSTLITDSGPNGQSYVLQTNAQALAHYPHMRKCGPLLFVSGLSSRRPDNTHVGATRREDGTFDLDITLQAEACIKNLKSILSKADADLSHVVDMQVFLVDMSDFKNFNAVYNKYFDAVSGPTRTTVAVKQLPHPNLLVELKAIAAAPASAE